MATTICENFVSSLYTNIPHEGVQSALHFLKTNPDRYKYPEQPNPDILGELTNLVLKHNVFEFDKKFYKKYREQPWGPKWPPHMQIYSWAD